MIGSFVGSHRSPLDAVFKEYGPVSEDYPLLFQPESLAIYERLHNAKARLRASWLASPLPIAYLEDVELRSRRAIELDDDTISTRS